MVIQSNISIVIEKLAQYKAEMVKAIRRAIAPERWAAEFRLAAEEALLSEAGQDDTLLNLIPKFLDLTGAAFFGERSEWWMKAPDLGATEVKEAAVLAAIRAGDPDAPAPAQGAGGPADELDLLQRLTIEQAQQLVREWVMAGVQGDPEGKNIKGQDEAYLQRQGTYDNELVERVWRVFGIHPEHIAGAHELEPPQQEAIDGLTRHIVAYLAEHAKAEGGTEGELSQLADAWLRRVLAVWTQYMVNHLPEKIQKAMSELANE